MGGTTSDRHKHTCGTAKQGNVINLSRYQRSFRTLVHGKSRSRDAILLPHHHTAPNHHVFLRRKNRHVGFRSTVIRRARAGRGWEGHLHLVRIYISLHLQHSCLSFTHHQHNFISAGKKKPHPGERWCKGHICQLHTKPAMVSQLISPDHPVARASPPCELLTALGFV